jgi:hypothetical protein
MHTIWTFPIVLCTIIVVLAIINTIRLHLLLREVRNIKEKYEQ